jgi:hypothetical protein
MRDESLVCTSPISVQWETHPPMHLALRYNARRDVGDMWWVRLISTSRFVLQVCLCLRWGFLT